jgi:outer membrane protein TolC
VRQAELAARITAENAEDEVRGAWQRLAQAEVALAATDAEITLARENLRVAEQQVQTGAVTWMEVEDARLGLFRAELALLTGRVSRDLAALDLKTAMGEI